MQYFERYKLATHSLCADLWFGCFFGFVLFVHLLLDSFDLRGHFQLL